MLGWACKPLVFLVGSYWSYIPYYFKEYRERKVMFVSPLTYAWGRENKIYIPPKENCPQNRRPGLPA